MGTAAARTEQRAAGGYRAVAIGGSAGAPEALLEILGPLPMDYPLPILLVQHLHVSDDGRFASHLDTLTALRVEEAVDKLTPLPGCIYVAPANYHLLVEPDGRLALSTDDKVLHSRPAIDVLFESAAHAHGPRLACVVLSGASRDGAAGAALARQRGAVVIAQDPATARMAVMPAAVIELGAADFTLTPAQIAQALLQLQAAPTP